MVPLMLATGNPGKIAELRKLLGLQLDMGRVTLLTPRDWPAALPEVAETGATFAENALLKAQTLAKATGIVSLADDSGLCVDALGGRPGVHSARWAGEYATDADRNSRLLKALAEVSDAPRTARYVCVAALADPAGRTAFTKGTCEGCILAEPRGENGFGYDPLFWLPARGRTMAELTSEEKNQCSHRADAITHLAPELRAFLRLLV